MPDVPPDYCKQTDRKNSLKASPQKMSSVSSQPTIEMASSAGLQKDTLQLYRVWIIFNHLILKMLCAHFCKGITWHWSG